MKKLNQLAKVCCKGIQSFKYLPLDA